MFKKPAYTIPANFGVKEVEEHKMNIHSVFIAKSQHQSRLLLHHFEMYQKIDLRKV